MTDDTGLYPGKVFQVDLRNLNIKARSIKGGMTYKLEAEIVEDDFDIIRGHDLTGSLFTAMLECVEIAQLPLIPEKKAPEEKPYGKQAAELYKIGLFFNPHIMEKVGTDQEYLDWLKTQPCCVRGSAIYDKAHEGDIVAAHVRRIAAGAGTGIKPEYSAIPMCSKHHHIQHQYGESVVGGKDFMDQERARHLSRWMAQTVFGAESMGYVLPIKVREWLGQYGMDHYLPETYR